MHLFVGDTEQLVPVHRNHLVAFVQYAVGRRFRRYARNNHWQLLVRPSLFRVEKRSRLVSNLHKESLC